MMEMFYNAHLGRKLKSYLAKDMLPEEVKINTNSPVYLNVLDCVIQ